MSFEKMKRSFRCGADSIQRVRKAIEEKKPLPMPGRKMINPVRDNENLRGLVETMTKENGRVSDRDLSQALGTSRMSINRIRHDLDFSYKPLGHAPALNEKQAGKRL